ncbi:uncharacterized protein LOC105700631 [Orussus abietinus]|uniref:uncharacterized protein LOC105700631 n=1 Tax=Orussus abietinus TaxID=222816 RepID=UPI00062676FC|nr:uncharacterized protein LOC105700631 [Orussus abietinus]
MADEEATDVEDYVEGETETETEGLATTEGEVTAGEETAETAESAKGDEKIDDEGEETKPKKRKRRRKREDSCWPKEENICAEGEPLWRIYMKSYVEREEKLKSEDKYLQRKPGNFPKFPNLESSEGTFPPPSCLPQNAFNARKKIKLPSRLNPEEKTRIWRKLREASSVEGAEGVEQISKDEGEKWPGVWPCLKQGEVEGRRKRRKKGGTPCEEERDRSSSLDNAKEDYADFKELGHARIPETCPKKEKNLLVDRAAGEHPGLVDGDYIVSVLSSKKRSDRVYATVCLRGLKGMHLPELDVSRTRWGTWKFCFYQAVVALLVKTQLRYKFAWGANIDYIYDHAWLLFVHMGSLKIREHQRLDDVVVYNYRYSVEVELVQELKDLPRMETVSWDYLEKNFRSTRKTSRPELMHTRDTMGWQKTTDRQTSPIHESTRKLEEWFDGLEDRFFNCIFRTPRFCLAFWRDGFFWYLYNPYRCDEFGFWDDQGYACILKFCTKKSLKRHLMILLLRAYAYERCGDVRGQDAEKEEEKEKDEEKNSEGLFSVQIYQMIYHCGQLHNLRLMQRVPPKPRTRLVPAKVSDPCSYDPLDIYDPCEDPEEAGAAEEPRWLKRYRITWSKCRRKRTSSPAKLRWHQFYVEEPNKLFSLWGELHTTQRLFPEENRGKQMYACYVVCAGMTRIMAPEYWTAKTLDAIVMCGDKYYTMSKLGSRRDPEEDPEEFLSQDCPTRLGRSFKIGETFFEVDILPAICGRLYAKSGKNLRQSLEKMFLKHHFGILTCESTCVGLFKFCGAYYMCDVRSSGPPIFQYGDGVAYLIRTTGLHVLMVVLVLTIGAPECSQFVLNPIDILRVVDMGSVDPGGSSELPESPAREVCPFEDDRSPDPKKWRPKAAKIDRKTIDRVSCRESPKRPSKKRNGCS